MSTIVNKSSVRFVPKVKRRSVSGTPHSKKPSDTLTPTPDKVLSYPIEQQDKKYSDDDNSEEEEDIEAEKGEKRGDDALYKNTNKLEEMSHGSRPKRLSTLSTMSHKDLLKRPDQRVILNADTAAPSDSDLKLGSSHIIGIPIHPPLKKRRTSSAQKNLTRRRLSSAKEIGIPLSPMNKVPKIITKDDTPVVEESEIAQSSYVKSFQSETPSDDVDIKVKLDEITTPTVGKSIENLTPPSSSAALFSSLDQKSSNSAKVYALYFDDKADKLRKIEYKKGEEPKDVVLLNSFKSTNFAQLSRSFNTEKPELFEKVTIDEESFKLEDLCKPTLPIGKTSSYFKQAQEARKNKMRQRILRRKLRVKAKEQRMTVEEYLKQHPDAEKLLAEGENDKESDPEPEIKKDETPKDDLAPLEVQDVPLTNNAIQLKIRDGALIVDEESRVIDRHAQVFSSNRERHHENPFENIVNSATYGRHRYTDKWDEIELRKFYKALGQWGTDFALIAQMFPHRTRRQVKAKFILEEKRRPQLVDLALSRKLPTDFDLTTYENDANKKFATLEEFNEKLEQLKREHELNLKELSIAREKAKEEDLLKQKKKEYDVQTGHRTLTRQERLLELRRHETVIGSVGDIKKQKEEEVA